jgi:MFS transporter, DHA1 family, multidrug resistance protein
LAKLSLSVYMIGFGISQIVSGLLSDSFGRKPVLIYGLLLFLIASFMICLTNSITLLIILRVAQGLGAATASVNAKTILTDRFTGKQLNTYMSYLVISWALGPIIGPLIGGYLQWHFNWQANFIFYCGYSLMLLSLVVFSLTETINQCAPWCGSDIRRNIKTVLGNQRFLTGSILYACNYAILPLFAIMSTFLIQHPPLNLKPTVFGHIALIAGVAFLSGALFSRTLIRKLSNEITVFIGCSSTFALSLFYFIASQSFMPLSTISITVISGSMIFFVGITATALLPEVLQIFPDIAGTANAVFGSIISLIAFILTTITSFFNINNLHSYCLCFLLINTAICLIYRYAWQGRAVTKHVT